MSQIQNAELPVDNMQLTLGTKVLKQLRSSVFVTITTRVWANRFFIKCNIDKEVL
jgi:hypothetical protein